MNNSIKNFIKASMWCSGVIFILLCWRNGINFSDNFTLTNIIKYLSQSIGITVILMFIYEHWLWKYKWIIWTKVPRLKQNYGVIIEYCYNGKNGKKECECKIKQTLLTTNISIYTDEIVSHSFLSNIVFENEQCFLIYSYITNPKDKYSSKNPMKFGTCRLLIKDEDTLEGIYWTSGGTTGDICLTKKIDD